MAESRTAVLGAVAANTAIAVMKFGVAAITGSSAMLSEGIHSVVDTGNGLLLLVGMKLSQREATPKHPFGHGKELYFWSLIVAVLIFGVGGGISAYEGVLHMMNPHELTDPMWNYVVLGVAAIFEGASFAVALRIFIKQKGDTPMWRALTVSKDPSTYTILAEDFAALLGLVFAAIGIWSSQAFDMPMLDGAASVVIGVLLAGVAVLLIREARGLLIGEGVSPETAAGIRRIALADPHVRKASAPLSMYIGPEEVLLTLDVQFAPDCKADDIADAVRRIEREIRGRYPRIKRIYIEGRKLAEAAAS